MKAQGLSMSILVVAAIAVMVLLVLGVFFTGGFRKVGSGMMDFVEGAGGGEDAKTVANCNTWCINNASYQGVLAGQPPGCTC